MAEILRAGLVLPLGLSHFIDTRYLCRHALGSQPANFQLGTLFQHLFHKEIHKAHDALADTNALASIFTHKDVWFSRVHFFRPLKRVLDRAAAKLSSGFNLPPQTTGEVYDDEEAPEGMEADQREEVGSEPGSDVHEENSSSPWSQECPVVGEKLFFGPNSGPRLMTGGSYSSPLSSFMAIFSGSLKILVEQTNL